MARVSAFPGIHFQPQLVALESVLAPPFDVIGPELQLELYGRAMQNVVRIELGRDFDADVPGERDRYTRARDHLRVWLQEGVLVQDPEPSLYIHRHSFRPPGGGGPRQRLGCFAGVEPVPHQRREVLRHELTMSAPREDRLHLLQATRTQTSPVFLLYQGRPEVTYELEQLSAAAPPLAEAVVDGEYGPERHQLWRVSDEAPLQRITSALSSTRLFIADGHHRYETALNTKLDRVLALLAPLEDDANVILPTHRVVPDARLQSSALGEDLKRRGWQDENCGTLAEGLTRIASLRTSSHAFGIAGTEGQRVVARPRAESVPSPRQRLDVSVLEQEILEPLLGVTPRDAEAGRLIYARDPEEALELALSRDGVAFLVNPPTAVEMAAVADADEAMPQKSTYFFPKVPAGLVLMAVSWPS
ncbi:MAG: DUF1015 family protein [Candidatus Dormibacteria bacterium]